MNLLTGGRPTSACLCLLDPVYALSGPLFFLSMLLVQSMIEWALFNYFSYCAGIHLSEPVSLTATSEIKMCRGLPSAVPRCSVETSRGPAFL